MYFTHVIVLSILLLSQSQTPNWITLRSGFTETIWNVIVLSPQKSFSRTSAPASLIALPLRDIHRLSQLMILAITATSHLSVNSPIIMSIIIIMSSKCLVWQRHVWQRSDRAVTLMLSVWVSGYFGGKLAFFRNGTCFCIVNIQTFIPTFTQTQYTNVNTNKYK